MKFLCDQMLGTLAKWLRIYGFDTFYADSEITDDDLLEIAKKENRCLITRDKELIIRSKKRNLDTIQLNTTDLDEQLKIVLKNIKIDKNNLLSRCTICNTEIDKISKQKIKDKVPPRVYNNNDNFWYCPKCEKVYWTGSHYQKIKDKVEELEK